MGIALGSSMARSGSLESSWSTFCYCWLARPASRCRRAYILPVGFSFVSTTNLEGNWTDFSQTWTHNIHLRLLFEYFGPKSPEHLPMHWLWAKKRFWGRTSTLTKISLQRNKIWTIAKKLVNLQRLPYSPHKFGGLWSRNGWKRFASFCQSPEVRAQDELQANICDTFGRLPISADWTFLLAFAVEPLWADIVRNRCVRKGVGLWAQISGEWGVAHKRLLASENKTPCAITWRCSRDSIHLAVLAQYRHVKDGRTDGRTDTRWRLIPTLA